MYSLNEPILYDSLDLNDIEGVQVTGYDTFRPPTNDLKFFDVVLADRGVAVTRNEHNRRINVRLIIARKGRELFEDTLDTLNRRIKKINKTLEVPLRNSRYEFRNVTYENMTISEVKGGFAEVDITFVASDPYSHALTLSTALVSTNLTSTPQTLLASFEGNCKQLAITTITITGVEPETTEKQITLTNQTTSESITIERTYTDGEILIINHDTKSVTVDGETVDYSGNFFEIDPDEDSLTYSDNFTTRDVDLKIEYYKRYS